MRTRRFIAWLAWSSVAGFGIVLPLMIGAAPENALLASILRVAGCVGLVVGLVAMFRSSGATASGTIPAEIASEVPRTLCNNPLAAGHGALPLAERIDMAAEASSHYDRSFGVIHFDVPSYDRILRSHGAAIADAAMDFMLGMVQMVLRGTDRAELVGKGQFVVCVALLPDHDTLQSVRNRAARVMNNMRLEALHGEAVEYDSGVAIYPTHGRSGAELIAHAQRQCAAARKARQPEEAPYATPAERRRAA